MDKKYYTTKNEKSLLESEIKLLKLTVNLEKIGDNNNLNKVYKNLIINFRDQ